MGRRGDRARAGSSTSIGRRGDYVKVAFFRGTSLRPVPPGESKHKEVRYLDIHEDDQLDEAQFAGRRGDPANCPANDCERAVRGACVA